MNTIKKCFEVILRGNKDKSRQAARRVRKLLYGSKTRDKYGDIKNVIKDAPLTYDSISQEWRQENFVVAVSVIYFLHDKEANPDFLFPWLFKLLLHSNGIIRYAAVRMITHELGPLTVHIRLPDRKPGYFGRLAPEQADLILFSLFVNLRRLLMNVWKPAYNRYKYISSLPTSTYKSAQMILAEMEKLCGEEYMNNLLNSITRIESNANFLNDKQEWQSQKS